MNLFLSIALLVVLQVMGYREGTPEQNYEDFRIMHILVLLYLLYKGYQYFRENPGYFLINPLFTTLVITFGLGFGVFTNFLFLKDGEFLVADYQLNLDYDMYWYKRAMFNIGLALVAFIDGHRSAWGTRLYEWLSGFVTGVLGLLGKSYTNLMVSTTKVYVVYVLLVIFRFWLIDAGLYGRLVSPEVLVSDAYTQVSQYINIIVSASLGAFFFVAMLYYRKKCPRLIMALILVLELFLGFLAGSRGLFLLPLATFAFAGYLTKKKVTLLPTLLVTLGLFIAMTIIVPFKAFYDTYRDQVDLTDPIKTTTEFYDYFISNPRNVEVLDLMATSMEQDSWFVSLFSNTNYSTEVAASIRHVEEFEMPPDSPEFVNNLVLSPVYAVVPRFLLPSKPVQTSGLWFREKILQHQVGQGGTSIGYTAIGHLQFTGKGPLLVFLGFWFVGVLQSSFFQFLKTGTAVGLVIFLVMMSRLHLIDSIYDAIIITYIRNIFIAIAALMVFLKPDK